jgi:hypothetical protein
MYSNLFDVSSIRLTILTSAGWSKHDYVFAKLDAQSPCKQSPANFSRWTPCLSALSAAANKTPRPVTAGHRRTINRFDRYDQEAERIFDDPDIELLACADRRWRIQAVEACFLGGRVKAQRRDLMSPFALEVSFDVDRCRPHLLQVAPG